MSNFKKLPAKEQLARMRAALQKAKLSGHGAYKRGRPKLRGHGAYKGFAPVRSLMSGRGAYKGFQAARLRGRGDIFDSLGGLAKGVVGGLVDTGAGIARNSIGRLFGAGDYRIAPDSVPLFESSNRANEFVHKEYLGDIFSSQDFSATTFNINPGLGDPGNEISGLRGMFPWLARIAQQYEEYKIDGMVVYYVPTSSDSVVASATTPALGSVSIATEYNSNKDNFTNLVDMLNHQFSNSKKPSEMIAHPIECARKERPQEIQYVRSDTVSQTDLLHYDLGKTTVAVTGCQADGQNLGQLWVSYKVTMFKPILAEQAEDPFVLSTHYRLGSTVSTSAYFGTDYATLEPEDGSTFDLTLGTTTIVFPANITDGHFMLSYHVKGSSATLTSALNVAYTTNCAALALYEAGTTALGLEIAAGTAGTVQGGLRTFKITGPEAKLTFSNGTMPASVTSGDLIITQINVGLLTGSPSQESKLAHSVARVGCFWRPSKAHPNPPWIKRVTEEEKRAVTQADLMAVLKELVRERTQPRPSVLAQAVEDLTEGVRADPRREVDYEMVEEKAQSRTPQVTPSGRRVVPARKN